MRKFILVAILLLTGVFGVSSLAYATNDGHLDGVWLSARIKTAIPKAVNFAGAGPFAIFNKVPVDTGPGRCYALLTWQGPDTFKYDVSAFCLNGDGAWEREEYNGVLYELSDSKQSLGSDWSFLYLVQNGRFFADFPADFAYTGFEGGLILTPNFSKNGDIKSVKTTADAGMIYSWDNFSGTGGTSRPTGFQLKFVKTDKVPDGAKECAELAEAPLCDIEEN